MKYKVNIGNKEYFISVEAMEGEKKELDEKYVSGKTDSCDSQSAADQCFNAVMAEYESEVTRASKLDNKVYILLTVCAFIFTRVTELIEKIPSVKKIEKNETALFSLFQSHYTLAVGVVTLCFGATLVLLVILLSNIKMERLNTAIILEENLMELPQKTTVKFLCSKYTQTIEKNRETLKRRYILFNVCVVFLIFTIVALIMVTYAGSYVIFNIK